MTEHSAEFVWVVMDEGCQECGVSTEPIGIYRSEAEANAAAEKQTKRFNGWRDGGQASVEVYKLALPALTDGLGGSGQ